MNVSITAVATDLNVSVSTVQSAIALEALVSAAFILRVAMLVPVLACLLGFANSFRMMRLTDAKASAAVEGLLGG